MEKVWIITGCSTGFGRELAKLTLKLGYKVGVASRKTEDVKDIIAAYPATALALKLDVTKPEEIRFSARARWMPPRAAPERARVSRSSITAG